MKGLGAAVVILGLIGVLITGAIMVLVFILSLIVPLFQTAVDDTSSRNFVQRLDLNVTIN